MSEGTLVMLFGAFAAWCSALSVSMLGLIIAHVKMRVAVDLFIDSLGKNIAKALHADDNHLNLDQLIDEYRHHEFMLTTEQWKGLKVGCDLVMINERATPLEKSQAAMLSAICEYKIGKSK